MKTPEQDRLLDDVLRNEGYMAFRAELYQRSLAEFSRQRWLKTRNQLLALAACVPVVLCLYLLSTPRPVTTTKAQAVAAIVRSMPLAKDQIVATARLAVTLVKTMPQDLQLSFKPDRIEVVHTSDRLDSVATISDEQLLALFQGHPIALVTPRSGTKAFVFLDIDDQMRFFGPTQRQ
jgi:hypothetical protein